MDAEQALARAQQAIDQADALLGRPRSTETPKLFCPHCGEPLSRVVNSRVAGSPGDPSIRRTRLCLSCQSRYTTLERIVPAKRTA